MVRGRGVGSGDLVVLIELMGRETERKKCISQVASYRSQLLPREGDCHCTKEGEEVVNG